MSYYEKQWIDAGGNPAVRHEGVAPSNNLIKRCYPPGNGFRWADPEVIVSKQLAQLGEQRTKNLEVMGSIPILFLFSFQNGFAEKTCTVMRDRGCGFDSRMT